MSLTHLGPTSGPITLDDLWSEAEKYGAPKLEKDAIFGRGYEAQIKLTSRSSTMWIKHIDSDKLAALAGVIEKARAIMSVTQGE